MVARAVAHKTVPTGMMGYPPRGDGRRNVPRFHSRDGGGAEVPIVQGASLGCAQGAGDDIQGGDGLGLIVGMGGQGVGYNQDTVLFHGSLGIVMLIKALLLRHTRKFIIPWCKTDKNRAQ